MEHVGAVASWRSRAARLEDWADESPTPLATAIRRRAAALRFLAEVYEPIEAQGGLSAAVLALAAAGR